MDTMKCPVCQSCAMPMKTLADFGTHKNDNKSPDYCCYCFKHGEFTEPNITMEEMIEKCVKFMQNVSLPDSVVQSVTSRIPTLKRWQRKPTTNTPHN